jgi:hypothetical protein
VFIILVLSFFKYKHGAIFPYLERQHTQLLHFSTYIFSRYQCHTTATTHFDVYAIARHTAAVSKNISPMEYGLNLMNCTHYVNNLAFSNEWSANGHFASGLAWSEAQPQFSCAIGSQRGFEVVIHCRGRILFRLTACRYSMTRSFLIYYM